MFCTQFHKVTDGKSKPRESTGITSGYESAQPAMSHYPHLSRQRVRMQHADEELGSILRQESPLHKSFQNVDVPCVVASGVIIQF